MIFNRTEKNIREKLKAAETAALKEYCKSQNFTEEETSVFIENTILQMFDNQQPLDHL